MGKGSRSRRKKPRKAKKRVYGEPLGLLDPNALEVHRELEFLRDAARAGSGRVPKHARDQLAKRAEKLEEARRVARKYGGGSSTDEIEQE